MKHRHPAVAGLAVVLALLFSTAVAQSPVLANASAPRPVAKLCPLDPILDQEVLRVGGADRFAVSAAASALTFAPGIPIVFIASGATYPDALSGSAAAGKTGAPVLLVERDAIPAVIELELERLRPKVAVVLGGENSVSPQVELSLERFAESIERYAGADRYEVSAVIAGRYFTGLTRTAYVASGAGFADALSASAAAGSADGPVLLVQKDQVPESVAEALRNLPGLERIVVLGGRDSISDSVVVALAEIARTNRIAGATRFDVSAAASADEFCSDLPTVFVASGAVFPDALSGSAAAIQFGSPVLLVSRDEIPEVVKVELRRLNPRQIVVLGGVNTISDKVVVELNAYLRP
jgi:putative cell wall-binding protein